ncbi:MAG: serine protein kinase RIO [Oligoflexia bacterium]|nr:serine protein kinase RIO [Oligoflexia bacterium]
MRIPKQLEPLFDAGLIQAVVRPLMSGKEAAAWVVRSEGEIRCAKVYKAAQSRSFKQRAAYTEGRRVRNSRQARAMAKRSKLGRKQVELSWQTAEVDALYKLTAAGVRVPAPVIFSDGVLLMELVLDHNGDPAPRLFDVPLQPQHARAMLHYLAQQCARMLVAGVVHGDLSEYNVLIAWDGPVIIDLPQAIDASANRNARDVFIRDLDHLTRYLSRFAPELARTEYGREIWNLYETGRLKADAELTGQGPKRSTRRVDGARLAREVEEAAEAERPSEQRKPRRKRRRRSRRAKVEVVSVGPSRSSSS